MKFFSLVSYIASILIISTIEIAVARSYDPSVFSYMVLISMAVIAGILLTILLALTSKAS